MPDEPFVISPSAPPPPTEADYEAIHVAVMETVRGRWFLSEYAERNRHADTSLILAAIDRVEALWRERGSAVTPADRVHFDLVEMANAIARTRSEIAAIKPDGDAKGSLSEASEELDSIVHTTERATSDILAAAEQVQEIAWTLREHGANPASCDALDQRATEIYSACSFQDLTGQRTRKVVDVLRFLEDRIRAMIAIWGNAGPAPPEAAAAPHLGRNEAEQLAQREIDQIMPAPAEPPAAAAVAIEIRTEAHTEARVEAQAGTQQVGTQVEAQAETQAETQVETNDAPGDGMVDAVATHALDIGAEPPIPEAAPAAAASHAGPAVSAESLTDPVIAAAVAGATALALALEPWAIEVAPAPEPTLAPEPVQEAELVHQSVAAPEPQPEPQPQPPSEAEVEAADRSDPAAMLKRILALIRTPNGASLEVNVADPPAGASDDASAAPGLVITLAVPEAPADDDAAAVPASVNSSVAELRVAQLPPAEPHVAEPPIADAPNTAAPIAQASVAPTLLATAPHEAADENLMPLTVEQAVNDLLGKVSRAGAPQHASSLTPEPAEPVLPAAALTLLAPAAAPAAIERAETPFTLDAPAHASALAFVASAPQAVAPSEPAPAPVETAPAASEPVLPEPPHAEAMPPTEEPPAVEPAPPAAIAAMPAAAMPAPTAAPEADAPPVVTATFRQPSQPIAPALRPLLAAIAALSDEEKLALFS